MSKLISVEIQDFRAIHSAKIDIDGITIVTGENGCGKSTISKLIYQTYKTANEFESIINKELNSSVNSLSKDLEEIYRIYYRNAFSKKEEKTLLFENKIFRKIEWVKKVPTLEKNIATIKNQIFPHIESLKTYVNEISDKDTNRLAERLHYILHDKDNSVEASEKEELSSLFDKITLKVTDEIKNTEQRLSDRPIDILNTAIQSTFSSPLLPKKFEVIERLSPLTDWEVGRINSSFLIKEQVYIDTPMAAGLFTFNENFSHWNDLNAYLTKEAEFGLFERIEPNSIQNLKNDVFQGDVELNVDKTFGFSKGFIYKRKDGLELNLLDCATGLKSFAILQLLYKNGTLQKDTLVIIDEPEAHLHPQWVVEYARLIVLLNKEIGTKFLIASHHPDMINAIKYISEKEGIEEKVNFYLAEKVDDSYTYDYRALERDIEPIFESFNIAIDRINQYGATDTIF